MPTFTFLPQIGEAVPGPRDAYALDLPSAEAAKVLARDRLLSSGAEKASIAVGDGSGDDVGWLGVWDYERGGQPIWSPDD